MILSRSVFLKRMGLFQRHVVYYIIYYGHSNPFKTFTSQGFEAVQDENIISKKQLQR